MKNPMLIYIILTLRTPAKEWVSFSRRKPLKYLSATRFAVKDVPNEERRLFKCRVHVFQDGLPFNYTLPSSPTVALPGWFVPPSRRSSSRLPQSTFSFICLSVSVIIASFSAHRTISYKNKLTHTPWSQLDLYCLMIKYESQRLVMCFRFYAVMPTNHSPLWEHVFFFAVTPSHHHHPPHPWHCETSPIKISQILMQRKGGWCCRSAACGSQGFKGNNYYKTQHNIIIYHIQYIINNKYL